MKFKLVEAAESKICCICKKPFDGYGNDPHPVCKTGRCCDECNITKVLKARIEMLKKPSEKNEIDESLDEAKKNKYIDPWEEYYKQENVFDSSSAPFDIKFKIFAPMSFLDRLAELTGVSNPDGELMVIKLISMGLFQMHEDAQDSKGKLYDVFGVKDKKSLDNLIKKYPELAKLIVSEEKSKDIKVFTRDKFYEPDIIPRHLSDEKPAGHKTSTHLDVDDSPFDEIGESINEGRNNPYFTPYGYRDAAKVLNRTAPAYYWHLKEIEMDRGDGIKLANYALKKGMPVMIDKNSDPDYPEFYLKDGSSEYHWGDYFYTYGFVTPDAADLVPYDGKLHESILTEKDNNKMNEDMSIRAKLKALYPELNFGDDMVEKLDEAVNHNIEEQFQEMKKWIMDNESTVTGRDVAYEGPYADFVDSCYSEAFGKIYKAHGNIDIEASIQNGRGTMELFIETEDGESLYNTWDFEDECETIKDLAVESDNVQDFISGIEVFIESMIDDAYPREDDYDDDMEFDIEESHEARLMDSLYEGSDDFDEYDDIQSSDEVWYGDDIFSGSHDMKFRSEEEYIDEAVDDNFAFWWDELNHSTNVDDYVEIFNRVHLEVTDHAIENEEYLRNVLANYINGYSAGDEELK